MLCAEERKFTAIINGKEYNDTDIDKWELAASKRALLNLKSLLNGKPMMRILNKQIADGKAYHQKLLNNSARTWREARTDLNVRGITAPEFLTWYQKAFVNGSTPDNMFGAHPEHYAVPDGNTVEDIGGYRVWFKTVPMEEVDLPEEIMGFKDPAYPTAIPAAMLNDDGEVFAYGIHQIRPVENGIDLALRIIYPGLAPDEMIREHQEHLAIEFRNNLRKAGNEIGKTVTAAGAINGEPIDDDAIDGFELSACKRALANIKSLVRGDDMMELLKDQIAESDAWHKEMINMSDRISKDCHVILRAEGVSVEDFLGYMMPQLKAGLDSQELSHLAAHPEHYVMPPAYHGNGNVETIGGKVSRFKFTPGTELPDYAESYYEEQYPIKAMQSASTLDDGTLFLCSIHQARNTESGCEWSLRILYADESPDEMIREHEQHLAVEYRNYLKAVH